MILYTFIYSGNFPDGNQIPHFYGKIAPVKNTDSILVKLPVVINRDKGTTIITAFIDDNDHISELSEKITLVLLR